MISADEGFNEYYKRVQATWDALKVVIDKLEGESKILRAEINPANAAILNKVIEE